MVLLSALDRLAGFFFLGIESEYQSLLRGQYRQYSSEFGGIKTVSLAVFLSVSYLVTNIYSVQSIFLPRFYIW